jgi:pimeloyl-ACP methyl ester carboxylesterase
MVQVAWALDSTTLYGTLLRPSRPGPAPAVVLVAGSGPTDRDWNSPLLPGTNGSARLIAESLETAGFASLRYDKRASGPHAQENMRFLIGKLDMQSHVDEFAGAVRTLASDEFVRTDRIFALANSEGTLHALNYQVHTPAIPLAGLVLIGPPGRSVGEVARAQVAEQLHSVPNGDALLSLYDQAIERFLAGQPIAPDPTLPEGMRTLLQALETPANQPFARELWIADAASLLAQVDVPVLVIIGKKDIQVDWRADGEPLQRAAESRPDVSFLFPDNANHVLKHEPKPRTELAAGEVAPRYNAPDAYLDQTSMASIQSWLLEHL